ncbi:MULTISPECIES: transposase [unclassified Moorena]|uniref:transposase n=1 Tax=unclassified Moorena TaxID=2683338 RepID=UPI0013B6B1FF|nr:MULTISPECIES: transposase [unclassified Moorena]NEP33835.1 hypothetical protein [Moorena sp. SIO3B2]NEQ07051.1 hypothetical protein [Moorena sp. SIO4E2]
MTYYGALDCVSGEVILSRYKKANSLSTIDFIKHLQRRSEGAKIVLVWDGASYHRSQEFRDFIAQVNTDKQWNIHCLRFAQARTIRKSN